MTTAYSNQLQQIAVFRVLHEHVDLGARVVDLVGFDYVLVAYSAQHGELPGQKLAHKVLGGFSSVDNLHRQLFPLDGLGRRRVLSEP